MLRRISIAVNAGAERISQDIVITYFFYQKRQTADIGSLAERYGARVERLIAEQPVFTLPMIETTIKHLPRTTISSNHRLTMFEEERRLEIA